MIAGCGRDAGEDLGLAVGNRPARQYSDSAIDIAPCRHAGGPVASLDDAGIKVDRMRHRHEMAIAFRALVPFGLEVFQRLNQMIGRRDRIRAGAGLEHMHGMAAHLETKPDYTDLRAHHLAGCRLRNETAVGAIAALQGRKRTDAGTLLLDHGLKVNSRGRLEARSPDRIECIECADGAGLHVAGAAPVHPAVPYNGRKRRRLPHLERSGRHHVAMTLQDQRFPRTACGPVCADHRARFRKIMFDRAEPAQILEIVDVDMPVVDLVAALPQKITDHVLAWPLRAAGRRNRDKIPCGSKLGVEIDVDCVNDLSPGVTDIHLRHSFASLFLLSRPPQSNHTLPDFAGPRSEKVGTGFGSDCAPTIKERMIFSPNRTHFDGSCA